MRTFPKALSEFRDIVNERGARLRQLSFEELTRLGETPIEHLTVESRPATIGIIVQPLPSSGIRVLRIEHDACRLSESMVTGLQGCCGVEIPSDASVQIP